MTREFQQLVEKECLERKERMKKETSGIYVSFYFMVGLYVLISSMWGFRWESFKDGPYQFLWIGLWAAVVCNRNSYWVKENGKYANIFKKYIYIPVDLRKLFLVKLLVVSKNIALQTVFAQLAALIVLVVNPEHEGGKLSDLTVWMPVISGGIYWAFVAGIMYSQYVRAQDRLK